MGTGSSYGNELPVPCFFRKFLSLFLVFSMMALSVNLYAKEKRGAKLTIIKLDGQLVEGELITVKEDSLLLLDTEGKDVSINIADIKVITIVKKSKALLGSGMGFLIGGSVGFLEGTILDGWDTFNPLTHGIIGACLGLWIGLALGTNSGKDEIIQIEGNPPLVIEFYLDKLSKKARIQDYK